jgi:hypothetical protein
MFGLITAFAVVLATTMGTVACSTKSTETSDGASTVRAYADPATEVTLQGLGEADLAKYVQNGNAEFKAALTQEKFDETVAPINAQLGRYVSKEFVSTEEQGGYTIVHYKAKFEKAEVGIRMVFDKDQKVAGQWFE